MIFWYCVLFFSATRLKKSIVDPVKDIVTFHLSIAFKIFSGGGKKFSTIPISPL